MFTGGRVFSSCFACEHDAHKFTGNLRHRGTDPTAATAVILVAAYTRTQQSKLHTRCCHAAVNLWPKDSPSIKISTPSVQSDCMCSSHEFVSWCNFKNLVHVGHTSTNQPINCCSKFCGETVCRFSGHALLFLPSCLAPRRLSSDSVDERVGPVDL